MTCFIKIVIQGGPQIPRRSLLHRHDAATHVFLSIGRRRLVHRRDRTRRRSTARAKSRSLRFCRVLGYLLLSLSFLITLISPFSESVTTFDNFPRGGQDFELSCFLLIMLLCLTLLAALWGKGIVDQLFGDEPWEPHDFWEEAANLFRSIVSTSIIWAPPKEPFSLGAVPLPLRI